MFTMVREKIVVAGLLSGGRECLYAGRDCYTTYFVVYGLRLPLARAAELKEMA